MTNNSQSTPILNSEKAISICKKVIQLVNEHYVETTKINELATFLNSNLEKGSYQEISSYPQLAKALSHDLQLQTNDGHLYLEVAPQSNKVAANQVDWQEAELAQEKKLNFGFTELAILEENIGYLKIVEFMNPERGIDTVIAAMKFLETTSALIIDLRQNGGGYGGLAEYLASYFFEEEPKLLSMSHYREKEVTTYYTYSSPFVVGKRRLNQPLFILVDKGTASAAEWFAYTLQACKKGIVVGETTAGAANRNNYFTVDQYLRLSISVGKPIVEATKENWEGKGIKPDIVCAADEAKTCAWKEAVKLKEYIITD